MAFSYKTLLPLKHPFHIVIVSLPLAAMVQPAANAVNFRFDFGDNASEEFQSAAIAAGDAWSSVLKDKVVVDLKIEFTDLSTIGGDVLGGAQPGKVVVDYRDYVDAAFKDSISTDDYRGNRSLQSVYASGQSLYDFQPDFPGLSSQWSDRAVAADSFAFLIDEQFSPETQSSPFTPFVGDGSSFVYYESDHNRNHLEQTYLDIRHDFSYHQSNYKNSGSSRGRYSYSYSESSNGNTYSYIVSSSGNRSGNHSGNRSGSYFSSHSGSRSGRRSRQGWYSFASNREDGVYYDNNKSDNNSKVSLTRAQAKALGLAPPGGKPGLDAIIKINSSVDWDFTQEDGIESDRYDAVAVLQHEIGHALGIVSSVDALDYLATTDQAQNVDDISFSYLTPKDLFRYSEESAAYGVMDVTLGGEKYFSLNRGASAVRDEWGRGAYFSTGSVASGGDGYQGSHWRDGDGQPLGIMAPALQLGQTNAISSLDLRLLDVVGWDLQDSTEKRASDLGIDLSALDQRVADSRQQALNHALTSRQYPVPELEDVVADLTIRYDLAFDRRRQELFDELAQRVIYLNGDAREDEIERFNQQVELAAGVRRRKIRRIPKKVSLVDDEVKPWLDLSVDELANKLRSANAMRINRLSVLAKAAPQKVRREIEPKLEAALSQFVSESDLLAEQLLATSGPSNPVGYGYDQDWWFWFQRGKGNALGRDGRLGNSADQDWLNEPVYYQLGSAQSGDLVDPSLSAPSLGAPSLLEFPPDLLLHGVPNNGLDDQLGPLSSSALDLASLESSVSLSSREAQGVPEPSSVLALFGIAVLGNTLGRKRSRSGERQ